MDLRKPDEIMDYALRVALRENLGLVTPTQTTAYHKFFPKPIDEMDRDKLITALSLVQRTIRKNMELKEPHLAH